MTRLNTIIMDEQVDQLLQNRRQSVVPGTKDQGESQVEDLQAISNIPQLTLQCETDPKAVFKILEELRTSYDIVYTYVDDWKAMRAAKIKAQEDLFAAQTETSNTQELYNSRFQELLDERSKTRRLQGELNTI